VSELPGCPSCGKQQFPTKAVAKARIRQWRGKRSGRLYAYRCGNYWHIGHMPAAVKFGAVERDAFDRGERK
jgi:hypothetical protein